MRRWRDNLGHLLRSWLNCVLLREDALAQSAPHTYRTHTHTFTQIEANKLSVTYSMLTCSLWSLHSYSAWFAKSCGLSAHMWTQRGVDFHKEGNSPTFLCCIVHLRFTCVNMCALFRMGLQRVGGWETEEGKLREML